MKSFFLCAALTGLFCLPAAAQQESAPATTNAGNARYPALAKDLAVTFQMRAPEAKKVELRGGAGLVKDALALKKGDDGVWTGTTPPAVPGFHYYWFEVDGVIVNDIASRSFYGWGRDGSGIEIPENGADGDFYAAKEGVLHGEVRVCWYDSKITGRLRRVHVYTPPGYDEHPQIRYPVLYLQHGAGENERGWVEQGRANFILDNLIASGKAVPMILVADTGYAARPGNGPDGKPPGPNSAFEEVMTTELIPLIDSRYRTLAGADHRAMAGLSMGSMQTLNVTLKHLDLFQWIGAMSGPPRRGFELKSAYDGVFNDAAAFNRKVKLLWFSAGTAETEMDKATRSLHEALSAAGITNEFYSSAGTDHEWQTWRRSLHEFAPKLFKK